jgi:hypothetical protein
MKRQSRLTASQAMDRFHEICAGSDPARCDDARHQWLGGVVPHPAESQVPVIMLTSRDMVDDKIRGFTGGAMTMW